MRSMRWTVGVLATVSLSLLTTAPGFGDEPRLTRVVVAPGGKHFVLENSDQKFVPWGFNYLGKDNELAEETWHTPAGWKNIETDFLNMRKLGANAVRWHLQLETFIKGPNQVDEAQLGRLKDLLKLAHKHQLYLDLTGLSCYRLKRIPAWYDALSEADRWAVQAQFWAAIAKTCAGDSAVFCYNLMNEPVVGAGKAGEHPWVGGELGGLHFVQRISNKPNGRDNATITAAWVKQLVTAIRQHDQKTLTTVGVIPWAFIWPNAKPVFYTKDTLPYFDFVSVHVYPGPAKDREKELKALAVYNLGKPVVIEETFPLNASPEDWNQYLTAASPQVAGWFSHYFGRTPEELRAGAKPADPNVPDSRQEWQIRGALVAEILELWQKMGQTIPKK